MLPVLAISWGNVIELIEMNDPEKNQHFIFTKIGNFYSK